MQIKPTSARHRKPSVARAIAARTAVSATGAAAALLVAAGTATAATSAEAAEGARAAVSDQLTPAEGPCTNTPLDAIIGPLAQTNCNDPAPQAPDDVAGNDPTEGGSDNGSGNGSGSGSGSGGEGEREGRPAAPGVPFPGEGDGNNPPGS